MLKISTLFLTLLIPTLALAEVEPLSTPSPNVGTITPAEVATTGGVTVGGQLTVVGSATIQGVLQVSPTDNIVGDGDNSIIRLSNTAGSIVGYGASSVTVTNGVIQDIIGNVEVSRTNSTGIEVTGTGSFSGSVTASSVTAQHAAFDAGAAGTPIISFKQAGVDKAYVYYTNAGILQLSRNGGLTDGININSSDWVGVGTNTPQEKLDVFNGNIKTNYGVDAATVTLSGGLILAVRNKAAFDAATGVVGQSWLCSDCTIPYSLCVGTGTTLSGWKVSHSATVGCGTGN